MCMERVENGSGREGKGIDRLGRKESPMQCSVLVSLYILLSGLWISDGRGL